jgi:hypothetical protein
MLEVAAGRWDEGQSGPVGRGPVIAHEVRENRHQYRHKTLRDRPPRAAVADDQCIDLEYVFCLAREHARGVVLPSHDAPDSLEGEPAGQAKPSCTRAKCTAHEVRLAINREMFSTEPADGLLSMFPFRRRASALRTLTRVCAVLGERGCDIIGVASPAGRHLVPCTS